MKISLNWVKNYTDVPISADELVEKIGSQLGAVEEVVDTGKKYKGIVIVKVITSEKHPDADKLHVCTIDDGGVIKDIKRNSDGLIKIVCGAPNVQAGMLAAWIPPGAAVPATTDKESFKVDSREIRGVISHGMLASPKELALGDNHEGLIAIDREAKPGDSFAAVYELDDIIIDVENKMFTHRPDCFGMLGIAREIAGIQRKSFKSPDWYKADAAASNPEAEKLKLEVKNEIPELVPRFCAVAISGIEIRPSSVILQSLLSRVGIKPVNNIVDLTNYLMLETGQPMHAYDYDKVKAKDTGAESAKLIVRRGKGENLTLLGGKVIKSGKDDIVIATASTAIGLGGVMGGADTEVDEGTKNIILECANFDMNAVRRTAMDHGLFTDAAVRFTKGQSALQNMAILTKMVQNILHSKHTQAVVASRFFDEHSDLPKQGVVTTTARFINSRLGIDLDTKTIINLLQNVEFEVSAEGEKLAVKAPFWRTDIGIQEDIVEEVGRLYGYEHLPLVLPQRDLTPAPVNELLAFKSGLRNRLSTAGANEVLTYSFVPRSLINAAGQDEKTAFHIRNALSPGLQHYRLSLAPSLLEKVHPNIKAGFDEFVMFEIGKTHQKDLLEEDKLPAEPERLSLVVASKTPKDGAAFYEAKRYCEYLMGSLEVSFEPFNDVPNDWAQTALGYEPKRSAVIMFSNIFIGIVGEPSSKFRNTLKLPAQTSMFELDIAQLAKLAKKASSYKPLNRYPSLDQDLCLKTSSNTTYEDIAKFLKNKLQEVSNPHGYLFEMVPIDIFQKKEDKNHKQITWHITLAHPQRTLTTQEANKLLDDVAAAAKAKLGADRI